MQVSSAVICQTSWYRHLPANLPRPTKPRQNVKCHTCHSGEIELVVLWRSRADAEIDRAVISYGTRRLNTMVVGFNGPTRAGPPNPPGATLPGGVFPCSTSSQPSAPSRFSTWIFWNDIESSFLTLAFNFSANSSHPFTLISSVPVVHRIVALAGTAGTSLPSLSFPAGRAGTVRYTSSAYSHFTRFS